MAAPYLYRALFPPHFTPRTTGYDESERQWNTLELPNVRLMGVLWSFGVVLRQDPDKTLALRLLLEEETPHPLDRLERHATPILFRAQVERLLQAGRKAPSATRMSLLAVDTISSARVSRSTGELNTFDPGELGFVDETWPSASTPLLLAPFGGQPTPTSNMARSFMPAMQLLQGSVRYVANGKYLARLRKRFGLQVPATNSGLPSNEIVLLPDGFCLTGARPVPWIDGDISGWFKATVRLDLAKDGSVRGLTPWIDPLTQFDPWTAATRRLETVLRSSDEAPGRPAWLQVSPNIPLFPEHLFWQETQADGPLLGPISQTLTLACPGLDIRLSSRPDGADALSTLSLQAKRLQCRQSAKGATRFEFTAVLGDTAAPQGVNARYVFSTVKERVEGYSFSERTPEGEQPALALALPVIETASVLRQAMGLVAPRPDKPVGLLWTFTPVTGGWLHWPLANATPGNLAPLLQDSTLVETPAPAVPTELFGALAFGNRPALAGHDPAQRAWGLSLSALAAGTVKLEIDRDTCVVTGAEVHIEGGSASFDGLFLVTPFAQTAERLLPDHAERALCTVGLRGVSPSLLRGIEAQLWKQERVGIRLQAAVDGLRITANQQGQAKVSSDAKVSLTTHLRVPDWNSSLMPWMWLAHSRLPTVQSQPLAVTGALGTQPSGARALAPLIVTKAPQAPRLRYEASLAFDAPAMDLTLQGEWSSQDTFTAATFTRPQAWPLRPATARNEIVMAVTTLPSVSLRVGEPGAGDLALDARWSTCTTDGVHACLRHDLALRDAHYASATPPPAPAPDLAGKDQKPAPAAVASFTPLPGNGPYSPPPKVGEPALTNGWDRVWRDLNRRAALAALDDRNLLRQVSGNSWSLTGVFGEQSYRLTQPPTLSEQVTLDSSQQRLASIGDYHFSLAKQPGLPQHFPGLPASDDLVGLAGKLARGTLDVDLRFGVAHLSRTADGGFTDQYGLASKAVEQGEVTLRTVQFTAAGTAPVRLLTLNAPLVVTNAGGATFRCVDVPVDATDKQGVLARFGVASGPAGLEQRINSARQSNNHLAGFRWSLADPRFPGSALIIVDGLVFEAMELNTIVQTGSDRPTSIKLLGRLRVPVSEAEHELPVARGLVILTLTPAHTGNGYVAALSLDEGSIELPFAGSAASLVPVASLKVLPVMGDTVGAEVKFAIGAQNYTVKGTIKHLAQGLVFQNDATLTGPSTAPEHLWPTRFEATLPAALASGATIVGVTNAAVTLEYAVKLGTDGARLGGELVYDLVRQTTTVSELQFAFSDSIQVPVRVVRPDDIALDRGVMALCWSASTSTSTVKLLGGLTLVKAVGTTLAALAPTAGPGGLPAFTVLDRRLRAHFTCTGESGAALELKLDDVDREDALSPRALGYRLHGQMSLNNALSWPVIVETREKDRLLADFSVKDDHFKHDVTLAFEGQAISPAAFHRHDKVHERLPLMVEAHHRLTRYLDQKQESIEWTVYQVVWLSSTTAFSKALEERVAPPRPLDIKRSRTGFAPFTGNVAKSLRAAPYSYHTEVVNCGGLAGPLAEGVSKALAGQEAMAVEFSNHALLAFTLPRASTTSASPPAPRPLLLGLAGFGLWAGGAKPFVPPPPLKYLLESRPEPGKPSQFWLPPGDGYEAHRFPASEQAIGRLTRTPVTSRAVADHPSAAAAFDPRKAHRAVFQPVVRPAGSALPAPELPAAGAAFILSALFEDNKEGALADHAPQAYGFAGSGRIDAVDFFTGLADASEDDLGRPTEFKPSVYANSLRRFLEYAAANGIVAANAPLAPVQTLTVEVQTLSRDGRRIIGVETRELQVGSDEVEAQLLQTAASWGVRAVQLRAPWAHVALLTIRRDDFGLLPAATAPYTYLLKVGARDDLPVVPRYPVGKYSLPPQPQRETLSVADANTRLLAGYAPLRVHPVLLSSDPLPMALDNAAAPRLMATGVETSWTLGNGAHAMLAGEQHDSYWLADRETVAFRPFAPPPAKGHYELTFALPPGFSAATPRGLLPASHALGKPAAPTPDAHETPADCALANVPDTTRAFAPAYSSATRISLRPGAWSASRMGLALDRDNLANPAIPLRVKASEMPVHLRQPRPPVLGVNDRPRASAYEPGHLALGTSQTVLVHGERATRVGAGSVPVGLDRAPRSRWASTLQMTAPANGILRTGWTGSITLQNIADHGDPPNGARSLEVAALVIGTERFNLPVDNASLPDLSGQAPVTLQGFIRSGYPATALEAVRGLPAGTPVTLELVIRLPVERDSQPLRRRVSFALITGGAVQGDIETPVYARFDDPEYNDRLTAIPQVNRQSSPRNPANDFVMAADHTKLAPGERIEAVLALRPAAPANPIAPGFEATGPVDRPVAGYDLDHTGVAQEVSLVLERIRVDEPTARRVVETPGQESAITGGIFDASSEDFRIKVATLSGTGSPITTLPFSIDTARLSLADTQGEPSPVFQAGDILMLRVSVMNGTVRSRALVSLAFNLLATPEFIPNPASFALLTLDGWRRKVDGPDWKPGAIQVGVALYTDHPTPSHIELVDPLDLLDGVARYRATYYWRTFSPGALAGSRRYALQKINAVGGTWLPDEPRVDWPGLE